MKKIRNKNNRWKVLLCCSAVLLTSLSCNEEQLELQNPNEISEEGFFRSETNYNLAINGMFHSVTAVLCWGRVIHTGPFLRSDAYNIVPFQENTTMSTLQGRPGISRWSLDSYAQFYAAIGRANSIINTIDTDNNTIAKEVRDQIAGQAYFMRGFAYWYLASLWGNVPIVTETPTESEDFFPDQSTQAEVYAQVIKDLSIAADRLPTSWEDSDDQGRPTQGAALALRGKTQLYIQNYTEAIADFQSVVDGQQYNLLPAANYQQNFTDENENNSESVFELQYLGQENFAWGADVPQTGTQGNYFIDYAPPTVSPDQGHFINPHIRDVFEANNDEVRRNATLAYEYPGSTGYGGEPFLEDFAPDIEVANTIEDSRGVQGVPAIFSKKYAAFSEGNRGEIPELGQTIGINWRVIRYADVLLMLAEALNEDNRTGEAIPFINQVRTRAQIAPLPTTLTKEETEQAIIDERILELTGEGHRFLDLVRWGIADEVLGQNSTIAGGRHPKSLSGGFFQSGQDELIWIPVQELQANPKLSQNDGY